ncbi:MULTISPECIES: DUF4304 domain-containing protein [Flavobacterium]|nr:MULTISPECIES: DUF4304 domain-containing protein [Flavobacterium]
MMSKDYKKVILDKLTRELKEQHFKKKGNLFSFSNGDLTYFIGVQSSQSSTASILKLTVNTEIASVSISKLDDTSLPIEHQRHYNRRIGFYLDDKQDKWWTVESIDSAIKAANEIAEIIGEKVIPNFETIRSTSDLVTLWRNGGWLGITEGQRKHYLSLLENFEK